MLLADTSVWIEHLRSASALAGCLEQGEILMHPFVRGELLLGELPARLLTDLRLLPQVPVATAEEVETLIDTAGLQGRGIGYVDAALLASTRLHGGAKLWTYVKRLALAAAEMSVGVTP
jgi:predicted nucleic acid-binding protein